MGRVQSADSTSNQTENSSEQRDTPACRLENQVKEHRHNYIEDRRCEIRGLGVDGEFAAGEYERERSRGDVEHVKQSRDAASEAGTLFGSSVHHSEIR